jgi:hypothetical protein
MRYSLGIRIIGLLLFILCVSISYGQNRSLHKLSLLYSQGNYRLTYWNADKLVNNPDYDTSLLPRYYRAISLLRLENKFLFKRRNPSPWLEGGNLLKEIKLLPESKLLFVKHKDEISALRFYLLDELEKYKLKKDKESYRKLKEVLVGLFEGLPNSEQRKIASPKKTEVAPADRELVVEIAQTHIGVPYVFGGVTPEGFDCSGFTCYVLQKANVQVGRSSRDQFATCRKIDKDEVTKGDLVFFNSGSDEVSHVGIIISEKGEPLKMIHASTSKGVIIADIESSDYWMKKLHGFGTFLNK